MIDDDDLPMASQIMSWLRESLRRITKRHSGNHGTKKMEGMPTQAKSIYRGHPLKEDRLEIQTLIVSQNRFFQPAITAWCRHVVLLLLEREVSMDHPRMYRQKRSY